MVATWEWPTPARVLELFPPHLGEDTHGVGLAGAGGRSAHPPPARRSDLQDSVALIMAETSGIKLHPHQLDLRAATAGAPVAAAIATMLVSVSS